MSLIYNIGTRAYFAGIRLAALFGHRKAGMMQEGRRDWEQHLQEKLDALKASVKEPVRFVWFHAASLGEFEQGRPLIETLRKVHPEYRVIQTFFSPSGYEVRKNYKGADIICYLPYDKPAESRRFVEMVQPEVVFFVKYEFWANILTELHARHIPTYLISGIFRERQIFFKPWGASLRPVLKCFDHLFVQDEESRRLLASVGVEGNVTICGDTRFDRVIEIQQMAKVLPWAEAFIGNGDKHPFTLVAGSSWPKDEEIFIDHFNRHPEMKLIDAPHEIHEEHVQSIIAKLKRPYMRYSQLKVMLDEAGDDAAKLQEVYDQVAKADCLIIDAIGFLSSIYRYGDAAYIGGGFGVGIHNTLEAAVYGIPVVFGPNHTAFREALGLIEVKGGFPIASSGDYQTIMKQFMTQPEVLAEAGKQAGDYVHLNSGATETIFNAVFKPC